MQATERVRDLVLAAQAAHPGIRLPAERFVRHLEHHRPEGAVDEAWLGSICAGDLYLACACVSGVPDAIRAFEAEYVVEITQAARRKRLSPDALAI